MNVNLEKFMYNDLDESILDKLFNEDEEPIKIGTLEEFLALPKINVEEINKENEKNKNLNINIDKQNGD